MTNDDLYGKEIFLTCNVKHIDDYIEDLRKCLKSLKDVYNKLSNINTGDTGEYMIESEEEDEEIICKCMNICWDTIQEIDGEI